MPFVEAGDIKLHYAEYGTGNTDTIVFIHGNLGCIDWMNLVWPKLADTFHIYAFDWRGCGESDKPEPTEDYGNYSMRQHAVDMINALKALKIERCHLINHSTGGIICTHMLLMQPDIFEKVLCLDPVGPQGIQLPEGSREVFQSMKENADVAFSILAGTAPTLFDADSFGAGQLPVFSSSATEAQKKLFRTIVNKTRRLSDGIWHGTPIQLAKEFETGGLIARLKEIRHKHLVVWGDKDAWIPRDHVEEMVKILPDCELLTVPGAGHSLNLEDPEFLVNLIKDFLGT